MKMSEHCHRLSIVMAVASRLIPVALIPSLACKAIIMSLCFVGLFPQFQTVHIWEIAVTAHIQQPDYVVEADIASYC